MYDIVLVEVAHMHKLQASNMAALPVLQQHSKCRCQAGCWQYQRQEGDEIAQIENQLCKVVQAV